MQQVLSDAASVVGYVNDKQTIECDDMVLPIDEAIKVWTAKLESVSIQKQQTIQVK